MIMVDTRIEPPEARYMEADCGCEVYEGEYLYDWEGKTYCPDCMEQIIKDLPLNQLVELLGGEATKVGDWY